jgi:hypothetical protein
MTMMRAVCPRLSLAKLVVDLVSSEQARDFPTLKTFRLGCKPH